MFSIKPHGILVLKESTFFKKIVKQYSRQIANIVCFIGNYKKIESLVGIILGQSHFYSRVY
ncbi:UNKNOWN [Stylonychia lemnae]|uniref:Uncharacterized protein n=1 Tax=Stylonychia lemnae TaxID=5949 RepID=A0A078B5G9_STYLE|nr:UNKNOWN [Stylonychia lemnae]|eukprot:CDW88542.1 UNKNOWN [Stylonychia lemnae]